MLLCHGGTGRGSWRGGVWCHWGALAGISGITVVRGGCNAGEPFAGPGRDSTPWRGQRSLEIGGWKSWGCLGQFNTDQDLPWNFLWCYLDTSAFSTCLCFAAKFHLSSNHAVAVGCWVAPALHPGWGTPGCGGCSVISGVSRRWHLEHLTAEGLRVTNDELRHNHF